MGIAKRLHQEVVEERRSKASAEAILAQVFREPSDECLFTRRDFLGNEKDEKWHG